MNLEARHLSRKFILALLALGLGTGALALGGITGELWAGLVQWTLGLYFAGNVGATVAATQQVRT